jgi:hypothetical protein
MRGGLNSLARQPTASVFIGSTGKETFSMRWQVEHSNVRSSKPLSPGEIRPSPILCLQVGHDGRSITEMGTRTTQTPGTDPDITFSR